MKEMVFAVAAVSSMSLAAGVPEPQPVESKVEITALYYPGTEQMSEWDMVAQTRPECKPLLGWYDEGNPEAIDWQIKWAVEHGISSFCVDWYWNKGYRRLGHWVEGFYKARHRKYLKWYMMYANHNQPGAHSTEDQVAVTKYWIDNYFKTPEYYTIDGKPVVCYWDDGNLNRDFIAEAAAKGEKLTGDEGIRRAFAISERMAREAGLPGIHWQLMWRTTAYDPVVAVEKRKAGFSTSISYGFVGDARKLAPIASAKAKGLTYDMVAEGIQKLWQAKAVQRELPWWLPIPTGWDDRPRSFAHSTVIRGRTVEKFAAICRAAREFCERNGIRHAVIHPINEWQEGSYIEPNEEYGFGMYDAIRDAFCERPVTGWPKNLRPADVGLGPYDYPPLFRSSVQRWDFAGTTEGWYRQPYGGGELESKDGCLDFWVTRVRNYNIRQRVVPFDASKYRAFRVRMRITPNLRVGLSGVSSPEMRLKWGTSDHPIIGKGIVVDEESRVAGCPVTPDGEFHEYALDLASVPDWSGMVDELWFEACQIMHARVSVDWMRFE
ncbi:MAG: glycoside hydrolase family 99-like domain-containing protein [Kiritimatiellae bacterium]|nr:glycoside hydrolase family 99-like domain-containing protein [Kiritimatiellia bacterium]MBQ3341391.1 glycoside hydrolase family 99-like domain-containing protein [Kiritimatiellia bacterium]